ncbi:LysR family transcriptional regulator [Crenobacter sp. SG2305]|uniref:LysR family transcriptional regulator n=1 Tax=Crenobacter oryzisoli TaxID=3056844 RepID=UPI0025AA361F|nr:LysR family transcriptional regulator [Crenobacter sp. SG2305]MDN0085470.1 LysR family transcriptional regulator [Crenobacter sp. SG2305]
MMDRLTAMRVFVTVVDRGSQSAAAEQLDMSRAMVSRYLAELEDWLGARLLHRTTRRLSLTSAGDEALPRCRQMLELADDTLAASRAPHETPQGLLRVTVSTGFGQMVLAPALADYVARYPKTAVDLLLLDRAVNLVEERIDLAVRISNDLDPNLIARKLSVCRSAVCAAPSYLVRHGTPQRAEELALHNCLTYSYFGKSLWRFERDGVPIAVPVGGNLSANESTVLLQAALAGAGITLQPTYAALPLIRSGQLVELLPDCMPDTLGIYGVYASRRQLSPTLKSLLDFLAERFGPEPYWDR